MTKKPQQNSSEPSHLNVWCQASGKNKSQVALDLASAGAAIEILRKILASKRKKDRETNYDCANWAALQAHQNGFNEAIDIIESILPRP